MGVPEEIEVPTIRKCAALSEFLFCLFSRFRRHCGYAKLARGVTTQNNFLICDYFA